MQRPVFILIAAFAGCACFCSRGTAQIPPNQRQYPEPLYSGIGSQGARPVPQSPDPVFFFEGKVNWPDLASRIPGGQPRTAWEYAQRAMYEQDDLHDLPSAIADYQTSASMNGRIQIVQARLGIIAFDAGTVSEQAGQSSAALAKFDEAIRRLQAILDDAPSRQGLHFKIGEAEAREHDVYVRTGDAPKAAQAWLNAEQQFNAELQLAPGSQRTHLALAELLTQEGRNSEAVIHLNVYLCQSKLHSDPYPFNILKARVQRNQLAGTNQLDCAQVGPSTP